MKSAILALVALPVLAAAQAIINTPPAIVQCQPVAIQFSGGQAPYFISVLPGGQQTAAPLKNFPTQDAPGAYTWTVDLPAGTAITFQIRDGSGQLNYSDQRTIQTGTDDTCLTGGGGASSASSAPPASSIASSVLPGGSSSPPSSTTASGSTALPTTGRSTTGLPTTSGGVSSVISSLTSAPSSTSTTGAALGRTQVGGAGMMVILGMMAMVVVAA